MRTAVVALKLAGTIPKIENADYVGCDRGALTLAKSDIHMTLALGDFDSVNQEEFQIIEGAADEIIRLNPIKDDSDSESMVNHLYARGYEKIYLIGALGGRADHAYVNLMLAWKHPESIILLDEKNRIEAFKEGEWQFTNYDYRYFSVFTFEKAIISYSGMKYPLEHREITLNTIYTLSNEIIDHQAKLIVHSGKVIVMQAKD